MQASDVTTGVEPGGHTRAPDRHGPEVAPLAAGHPSVPGDFEWIQEPGTLATSRDIGLALMTPSHDGPDGPGAAPEEDLVIDLTDASLAAAEGPLELSIVMPCLNEAETIAACIGKALGAIDRLDLHAEIVVADNGSTDGSQAIATELGARVVDVAERGYGNAIMGGVAAAHGRYVLIGDADDSYDFGDLEPFVDKLREGHDLVMGNRFHGDFRAGAMPALHRYVGTPALTGIERLLFRSPIGDLNCGMRALRRAVVPSLDLRAPGMEFASEMIVKASLRGLRIAEVPTTLSPAGRTRPPHLRAWRDGWRHLRFLLFHSPRWLFLYPGVAALLAGLMMVVGALVTHTEPASRVPLLLGGALAMDVGYQGVLFAFLANSLAVAEGLLPGGDLLHRLGRHLTLERGLVAGLLLTVAGSVAAGHGVLGLLSPGAAGSGRGVERSVVLGLACMVLGAETVLSSLLFGILRLVRP